MLRAAPRVVVFTALAGLALLVPLASAQQAEPTGLAVAEAQSAVVARTAAGVELVADLRPSYLAGRSLVVTLRVTNPHEAVVEFPRLDLLPHLVTFELVSSSGKKQTRYNTPPDEEELLRWQLPPRGSRQVSLEIPVSSTLAPGRYELKVVVQVGDEALVLGPSTVLVEQPKPVAADVTEAGSSTLGWQVPWVHQGQAGYDLYLHTAPDGRPGDRGTEWRLTALEGRVDPLLSMGRSVDGADRYVYWRSGERNIAYARLEERKLRHEPREVSLPYPSWQLLARAGGDAEGGLHVPVWIPAPAGAGGEVRVVSIDPRGQPRFRKVVALDAPPAADSWVDGAGRLRLLLHHDGKLDLYTMDAAPEQELPAVGHRLLPQAVRAGEVQLLAQPRAAQGGSASGALVSGKIMGFVSDRLAAMTPPPVLGVRFGVLPESDDQAGGTAVFAWLGEAEDRAQGLPGIWLSINGRVIATVPGAGIPGGSRVSQVAPRGYQPYILVGVDGAGVSWAHCSTWEQPIELGRLGPYDGVRLDGDGQAWLVRILPERGVVVAPVASASLVKP